MAITRRTDYAVRLMNELAQLPGGATLSLRDVCQAAGVPESFGQALLTFLVDAGLVATSGYGVNRYALAQPASEIAMSRIICACEPDFSIASCARDPQSCPRSSFCGAHAMWIQLDQVIWNHLRSTTLAQVAAGVPLPVDAFGAEMRRPCEEWPADPS